MVDAGLRARVDRLLGGDDFRVDDLTRLFLYARDRCDGRESVQEIGDFVAHHEQRNKGIITRETRDWFLITRVMVSAMQTPLQGDRLPPSFKEFLAASLRRIGPAIKRSGISLSKARRMLPAVLKKFEQNPDSTLAVSAAHSPNERELIKVLSSQITARPAFTAGKLFKDFGETLRSNGLLTKKEKIPSIN